MNEPKDKRTKAYKQWKKMQGAGDLVENVLKSTKIDKVAKWVLGEDCGCEKRKETLNKLFPFGQTECLTEHEYKWLSQWYDTNSSSMNARQQQQFTEIYNRIFHKKTTVTNCGKCVADKLRQLRKVYNEY